MKRTPPTSNLSPFHQCIVDVIRRIPRGRVASYGQIAALAGEPRAARQVVRVLHSLSEKYRLPWHRVINKQGRIALPRGSGYELQRALLEKEGIHFDQSGKVDLNKFGWKPRTV